VSAALPVLYSFRRCPYAVRARMALAISGQACALREIVFRAKPADMLAASPKGTVPVLVLPGGRVIDESLDIMHWTLERHDPGSWLRPEDSTPADMAALIEAIDGPFKHHLDRYKYAARHDDADPATERDAALTLLAPLNTRLDRHAFLFGARATLADIAIFPFVRQFANTDRAWFDGLPLAPLQTWLAGLLAAPLFNAVMDKYPRWSPGDANIVFGGEFKDDRIDAGL